MDERIKKYLRERYELYYVDYRDRLDGREHSELLQKLDTLVQDNSFHVMNFQQVW